MSAFFLNLSALAFLAMSFFIDDAARANLCLAIWAAIFCTAQIVSAIERNKAVA